MSALLLRDIGELITLAPRGEAGGAEAALGLCRDAVVAVVDGRVVYAGARGGRRRTCLCRCGRCRCTGGW